MIIIYKVEKSPNQEHAKCEGEMIYECYDEERCCHYPLYLWF